MQIRQTKSHYYLANELIEGRKTLFFLHGFPDNFYVWKELIPYLDESYNIVCVCAPGCSKESGEHSKQKVKDFRLKNLSLCYLEVLNHYFSNKDSSHLYQHKVAIIAHDMGGPYGHYLLDFLHPKTQMICINSLSGQGIINRKSNPEQLLRSSYMTLFQLPFVSKKTLNKFWYFLRENAQLLGRSDKALIPSEYDEHILNGLNFYKALILDTPGFLKKKVWANEVLFIWSKEDPFLVTPTEKELSRYYENISFQTIDTGHWPMLDDAKKLAILISQFVN
jgi:pimeloyl-ACP methyl ester carboxylesterase